MILPQRALEYAMKAHEGQVRKYTLEPYIVHPIAVALILQQHYPQATEHMISAALLHDVIEDTDTTIEDLGCFSLDVTLLVQGLTDVSKPEDGNRRLRKKIDCEHMARQSFCTQIIKCADLIHNTSSIVAHSPIFARIYIPEARNILEAMRVDVSNTDIWNFAYNQLLI